MKLYEVLKEILGFQLVEAKVSKVVTSFRSLNLPSGWKESHTSMPLFGNNWGRGVLSNEGQVIVTGSNMSHAIIKQKLKSTKMTFYWGFSLKDETLYLETASVRGDGFNRKNLPIISSSVMNKLRNVQWAVSPSNVIIESRKNDTPRNA